jgi:hypothetical protein
MGTGDKDELAFPDHCRIRDPDAVCAEGRRVIPAITPGAFAFGGRAVAA